MNLNDGFKLVYVKDKKMYQVNLSDIQEQLFDFALSMVSQDESIKLSNHVICELKLGK